MQRAIAEARNSIDDFIGALQNPESGKAYFIKVRLEAEGEVEHIWADSVNYSNGQFTGKIANDPYRIKSKKPGDTVVAGRNEISDWAVFSDSGKVLAGGYTVKLLSR